MMSVVSAVLFVHMLLFIFTSAVHIAGATETKEASDVECYSIMYVYNCFTKAAWHCIVSSVCQGSSASESGMYLADVRLFFCYAQQHHALTEDM